MKKLILAALLLALPAFASTAGRSTATPFVKNTAQAEAQSASDPCGDPFSSVIKDDMMKGVTLGSSSTVLKDVLGDEILIFGVQGYCQPREAENLGQDAATFGALLLSEVKTQVDNAPGHKLSYTSKITGVLGGSRLVVQITPPAEKVAENGADFRITYVFVFSDTRIVGIQLFTSVTGLKQP